MVERDLAVTETHAATDDGWELHLRCTVSPSHLDSGSRPLLIVPGYGMNSFIFSYHPRGTSMERTLAEAGFEVWSMNLRGQGPHGRRHGEVHRGPRGGRKRRLATRRRGEVHRRPRADPTLYHYAAVDVPCAIEHVLRSTRTRARELDLIGCSLGGSIAYSHLALCRDHRVARLITMGAPLRWDAIHPLVRVMFASPAIAGAVRLSRTRELVRGAMPLLLRAPSLLSLYMNIATIDTRRMSEMTRTVEDPHPAVNRDIAHWLKRRDLELAGVNITRAMRSIRLPLLVVLANRDGIVPERTALTAVDAWGSNDVDVLRVGDARNWYAHANLFVADDAPDLVFHPMIRWLRR